MAERAPGQKHSGCTSPTQTPSRIAYQEGDRSAGSPSIADLPSGGGRSTRDIQFTPGFKDDVCVGRMASNVTTRTPRPQKSTAPTFSRCPDGGGMRVFASGIHPVGLAMQPTSTPLFGQRTRRPATISCPTTSRT
jgi:glucose/arabinose dehydrogenase